MLSGDAIFSDILFTLNTVGVMTQELLKSLFLVQKSNQSVCSSYNNAISNKTSSFVFPEFAKFEHSIFAVVLRKRSRLNCNFCKEHSRDVLMLEQFVMPPTFIGRTI